MSARPHFVGDEAGAAGFRLAGFAVTPCDPGDARRVLEDVLADGEASLVLLASPHAGRLEARWLESLIRACDPPVSVVSDAAATEALPDLGGRIRAMLGVAT